MKSILVTGATGLIGSVLIPKLGTEDKVYALARRAPDTATPNVIHIPANLSGDWDITALPRTIDTVIHLAQSSHFREFPTEADDIYRVNTHSTFRLLEYARKAGAKSFVLASTGGVYGQGEAPFAEDSRVSATGDLGFYVGSKLMSEIMAENYSDYMNVIILRPFFVYGPGQGKGMLIPRLCHRIAQGEAIQMAGPDGPRLNPLYVDDATEAIKNCQALEESSTINIAGPDDLALREICECIGEAIGRAPLYEITDPGPALGLVGAIDKMRQKLHVPQVPFSKGVAKVIDSLGLGRSNA